MIIDSPKPGQAFIRWRATGQWYRNTIVIIGKYDDDEMAYSDDPEGNEHEAMSDKPDNLVFIVCCFAMACATILIVIVDHW